MRTKTLIITVLMALSLLVTACASPAVAQDVKAPTRTITVNGTAQAFLTPDIAYISIGVHTEKPDATEAVKENNTQAAAVIALLKDQGIAAKDIRTNNFSIYPSIEYGQNGERKGVTYMVDNTVSVTIRDLNKIGDLLDAVVTAGANSISGIQFDVANKEAATSAARKEAIANAQKLAQEMATAAGVTLGEVQTITAFNSYPVPVYKDFGGDMRTAQAAAAVPINTGEMTVTVDVTMSFEIR